MTTYRVTGSLTQPVNDLQSANSYLDEPMADYIKYCDEALVGVVLYVRWELTDEASWLVTLVTSRHLTDEESTALSEWISGQNSDGLGEGFEQQPFAEHEGDDEDDDDWSMSSFDWKTNPCTLREVL